MSAQRIGEPGGVVVPRPGATPDPAQVIAWCRERLAHFKCPVGVEFVEALPRNASGKLLKNRLRERYGAGTGTAARAGAPLPTGNR